MASALVDCFKAVARVRGALPGLAAALLPALAQVIASFEGRAAARAVAAGFAAFGGGGADIAQHSTAQHTIPYSMRCCYTRRRGRGRRRHARADRTAAVLCYAMLCSAMLCYTVM